MIDTCVLGLVLVAHARISCRVLELKIPYDVISSNSQSFRRFSSWKTSARHHHSKPWRGVALPGGPPNPDLQFRCRAEQTTAVSVLFFCLPFLAFSLLWISNWNESFKMSKSKSSEPPLKRAALSSPSPTKVVLPEWYQKYSQEAFVHDNEFDESKIHSESYDTKIGHLKGNLNWIWGHANSSLENGSKTPKIPLKNVFGRSRIRCFVYICYLSKWIETCQIEVWTLKM